MYMVTHNWRSRRSKVEDLLSRITAVTRSGAVEGNARSDADFINDLDAVTDGARRIRSVVRDSGMMPGKAIGALQDRLGSLQQHYKELFGQLEDAQRLAGLIASIASEVR
jgi:hypothetical protein